MKLLTRCQRWPRLDTKQEKSFLHTRSLVGAEIKNCSLGERSIEVLPGQYFDKETGTHYNYYRDYDPGQGRYIESDLLGLRAGVNTYAYAKGNPTRYADRFGLITDCEMQALMEILNKYGIWRNVNSSNFGADPNMRGHAGETSFFTGSSNIGTNPSDPLQYSGSVIAKNQSYDLLDTALHENAHQGEMNGPAPLSCFADSLSEKFIGYSAAEAAAQNIMDKNPGIVKEFEVLVDKCRCRK